MPDGGAQFEVFPTNLHLRRIDPVRNARCFYQLSVQPDLFGGASLIRVWGRIGTLGRKIIETYPDEGLAVNALMALAAQKRRRGYAPW